MKYFPYNNTFYKQKFGLPMDSQHSALLACIYLEFLESGPFTYIIPNNASYFRYIDDILLIHPQDLDLNSITDWLNNVDLSIKFTWELESNNTLHFLDVLLIRNNNKSEFRVTINPPVETMTYFSIHSTTLKRNYDKFLPQGISCLLPEIFKWWI